MQATANGAKVRFPPPLIYVAGLFLGVIADRLWHLPGLGLVPIARIILGAAGIIAGVAVSAAGVGLFIRRRTAIIPYKAATTLVTTGIYRWTRNPMYLGLALIYAGISVLLNSLVVLLLLVPVLVIIQSQVIAREEIYLKRAFGKQYLDYITQVRTWI